MKITPSRHPGLFISALVILAVGKPGLETLGVEEPWSFIPFYLCFVLLIFIVILDRQAKPALPGPGPARGAEPESAGTPGGNGVSLPGALLRMGWRGQARLLLYGVLGAAAGYVLVEGLERLGVNPSVTTLAICAGLLIQFQLQGHPEPKDLNTNTAPNEEPEK